MAEQERPEELTPEQLVEAIRQMKVTDVLVSTIATVAQLGYAKLEPASRDLEQAKLAIDSLRALVQVLEGAIPPERMRDFNQLVANLQLAYVDIAAKERAAEVVEEEEKQQPQEEEAVAPNAETEEPPPGPDAAG